MQARRATRDDLPAITQVVTLAGIEAYAAVLPQALAQSEARRRIPNLCLKEQLLAGRLFVLVDKSGKVEAVAVVDRQPDRVELTTVVAPVHPAASVTAEPLVRLLRHTGCVDAVVSDVVLGNEPHEHFHEAAGFVPGELVEEDVAGHPVLRRRWWLAGSGTGAAAG